MSIKSPEEATLDPCTQWINDNEDEGLKEKLSELEWLNVCIGPQRLDENILYPLTIIYIVMGITGILGNIMVCIVITRYIFYNRNLDTPIHLQEHFYANINKHFSSSPCYCWSHYFAHWYGKYVANFIIFFSKSCVV